jgi:hypothetical protein
MSKRHTQRIVISTKWSPYDCKAPAHRPAALVSDLSRDLPDQERYRRLLQAMRGLLPCDAAALLRLDGEWLVPLAVDG